MLHPYLLLLVLLLSLCFALSLSSALPAQIRIFENDVSPLQLVAVKNIEVKIPSLRKPVRFGTFAMYSSYQQSDDVTSDYHLMRNMTSAVIFVSSSVSKPLSGTAFVYRIQQLLVPNDDSITYDECYRLITIDYLLSKLLPANFPQGAAVVWAYEGYDIAIHYMHDEITVGSIDGIISSDATAVMSDKFKSLVTYNRLYETATYEACLPNGCTQCVGPQMQAWREFFSLP